MDKAFDTQQRLHLLKRFLEHLVPAGTRESPAWALHVGASPGVLVAESSDERRFLTVDRHPRVAKDYVRALGGALPFDAGVFEAVAAGDVLEHLPTDARPRFLSEVGRVSRGWVLVNGPFRSPSVEQAEESVSTLHRSVHGRPDEHLDEHWQSGLPDLVEARGGLEELGFTTAVVPNGSLFNWFVLKSLEALFQSLPHAADHFDQISELYIRLWSPTDHRRPTYRHLVLAHRDADRVFDLIQNPPSKAGLEFFGPETNVPNGNGDETQRIRATATIMERIISVLRARESGVGDFDGNGAFARLEQLVTQQDEQRGRLEREVADLRERLREYESSPLVRLLGRLRGR